MRVAALPTCAAAAAAFKAMVSLSPCRKHPWDHGWTVLSKTDRRLHSIRCSMNTLSAADFGDSNIRSAYLSAPVGNQQSNSTENHTEFPWEEAKSMVAERLLVLGKKALKCSFVLLFAVSFASDILMAVSRDRELMVPLGLFIGVALADFLKESLQLFVNRSLKDESFPWQLMGIGSFFVLIRYLSVCFNLQGRMFLSHIGNGGLMQVMWLAWELQHSTSVRAQEEQGHGVPSTEYRENMEAADQ